MKHCYENGKKGQENQNAKRFQTFKKKGES